MQYTYKVRVSIFTLLFLLVGFSTHSQDLSYHYKEGPAKFYELARRNIIIPNSNKELTGFGIIEFQIDAQGQMEGKILSTLNDFTTQNYLKLIDEVKDKWRSTGNPYSYRFSINYNLDDNELASIEAQVPGFSTLIQRFSDAGKINTTSTRNQRTYAPLFKQEKTNIAQAKAEGRIKDAYIKINELLRYLPIDSELIEARIELEQQLGISKFTPYDQNMISTFERMIAESQNASKGPQGMDTLYLGGMATYNQQLRESLIYPTSSVKQKNQGTVVYSITVDTSAVVSAKIFTLIDKEIEAAVIAAINRTSNNWVASSKPYTLYQAITFCDSHTFLEERPAFVEIDVTDIDFPMLTHVFKYSGVKSITTQKRSLGYTRTPVSGTGQSNNPTPRLSSSNVGKIRVGHTPNFKKIKSRLDKATSKGKTDQEFELLSEIIRYDPLNKSYIQRRYELANSLENTTFKSYDLAWFKALNRLLSLK